MPLINMNIVRTMSMKEESHAAMDALREEKPPVEMVDSVWQILSKKFIGPTHNRRNRHRVRIR